MSFVCVCVGGGGVILSVRGLSYILYGKVKTIELILQNNKTNVRTRV